MAAAVGFQLLSERGAVILDELERRTGELPYLSSESRREYELTATTELGLERALGEGPVGVRGFAAVLDKIAPDWREHLRRVPTGE